MMGWRTPALVLGTIGAVLLAGALSAGQEDPFPHEAHAGLFPVCTGCHAGAQSGTPESLYPAPSQCAGCHDGVEEDRVTWTGPAVRSSNVTFEHTDHAADLQGAGDAPVTCEECHSDMTESRMSVDTSEELDTCWSCHAHERTEHFAEEGADACASCHVTLAESSFDRERVGSLPVPVDHEVADYLLDGHAASVQGDAARCATCHTSDRCVACHVDAELDAIRSLPAAPPALAGIAWASEYPIPATHGVVTWEMSHAPGGGEAAECSTCHTQDDCLSCHIAPAPRVVEALPLRADVPAPGVALEVVAPPTHQSLFFMDAHANLAAADPSTCATCHTETYCVSCHDGPADGGYHEPSFVARHAADAYGSAAECATCHSTATFCRECHESSGFESRGRLGAGFHDAEPVWLLRHGGAARQNLESCASCHEQSDCVQCHGVLGAFRVSPHRADFDAESAWLRSPRTCLACHISNPLGGGE